MEKQFVSDLFIQASVFFIITAGIGALTWYLCRKPIKSRGDGNKEYFLAGGTLAWYYIAGSITLTNLSTDQLVGMNGNQMLLLAWWELAAVAGLLMLAYVFLPLYYRYQCVTTTELLEKKLGGKGLRAVISIIFLLGGLFVYLPIMLYTGSLFLKTMFDVDLPLTLIAGGLAAIGAAYAVFGGLRAVAVSDTISGVGMLSLCVLVVFLALRAINFDFSDIPPERLTMIGDADSPIPFATLFTGMIFIQMFYWSFNQTITQRAMAAPSLAEGQKGVITAAVIRLVIIPPIIVLPGVVAYKLYGDIGDTAYGRIVGDLLPGYLSGAFAAMMAAAVLTSFNSALNSATALYVCDIHERFFQPNVHVRKIATGLTVGVCAFVVALVPLYAQAESIINLVQQINGLISMPVLSAFIVAVLFRNMSPWAAAAAVLAGSVGYALVSFYWNPMHYIHLMALTLFACIAFAWAFNLVVFRRVATLSFEDFRPQRDASPPPT
jgi:SSS family solute:Na+ symporter